MKSLLRYGSMHRLWFPRGYKGRWWPQLNPTESYSHGANNKRTFSIDEPRWLHAIRRRLRYAGPQRCARRDESWQGGVVKSDLPDTWDWGMDGNRTCSYCGSLHPEDMHKLVKRCIATNAEDVSIEPSGKGYKTYVRQKGVVNASQGGIKFYMQHVTPELLLPAAQADYALACRLSGEQHRRVMDEMTARRLKK